MSGFKDFWYGFLKPLRDLASALLAYSLFTAGRTISSTLQNSSFTFNIWGFLVIFIAISSICEFILAARYDFKRGYKEPIDSTLRMVGILCGIVAFSFILIPIYYSIGGSIGDLLISEIIAAICMFAGMGVRLYILHKPRYY